MALHPVVAVAADGLAKSRQPDRLDRESGFLHHLARDRLGKRLAGFDHATRQRKDAVGRRPRPAHHQQGVAADDRGAHRQKRPLGI